MSRSLFCVVAAGILLAAGCRTQSQRDWMRQDPQQQRSAAVDAVVEAGELASVLGSSVGNIAVLDVRPADEYEAAHLPGAVRIEYSEWEQLSLDDATGLSNDALWRQRIGELGIDGDDTVIVYDGGRMTRAARVWFILQHFGVADARVVNGGFPLIAEAVAAQELELRSGIVEPARKRFVASPERASRIGAVDRFEVRAAIEAGRAQVFDARNADEFSGVDKRDNPRGGHLPDAINLPHAELIDDRNRLRPPAELAAILERAGFERGRPIITHCNGGGRAALAALAAARAGYGPVVNYYLSFGDWAKDASCPVIEPD